MAVVEKIVFFIRGGCFDGFSFTDVMLERNFMIVEIKEVK